ncbi:MAG: DNA-binding response regulator [Cyanobacteria bacterium J06632_22]
MSPEQTQEVVRLRSLNLSPKQIARKLGLRPVQVTAIIRAHAESMEQNRLAELGDTQTDLPRLEQCLINEGAIHRLLNSPSKPDGDNPDAADLEEYDLRAGMANIFLARANSGQYLFSGFLVDYWCLGVKDAISPQTMSKPKFDHLIQDTQKGHGEIMRPITLQQAQSIVFGAVNYAAGLGLKPHKDFEKAKTILGPKCDTLLELQFGRRGRPYYRSGITENQQKVMQTLLKNVGEDNFDFDFAGPVS